MTGDDQDNYMKQLEEQRKAFEAQFGSLESLGFEDKTKNISESEEEDKEERVDDKLSGSEEDELAKDEEVSNEESIFPIKISSTEPTTNNNPVRKPKVIKFNGPSDTYIEPTKQEQKLIRSGKTLQENARKLALREAKLEKERKKNGVEEKDEDGSGATEEENLHNDLELQQFLKESHLLSAFNGSNKNSQGQSGVGLTLESLNGSGNNNDTIMYQDNEVMGKARMKTLEHRLRGLAEINGRSKKISKLEKVPMAVRKGMVNKHLGRISRYEQDAKDGGIILSKVKKGQFRKIESTYKKDIERRIGTSIKTKEEERNARRERGLKVNSIGRSTRNGLIVSKEDIARINGSGNSRSGKKSFGKGFKKRGRGH
ncbi:protein Faf1p [Monosporozyma unispora]|nr:pre-rRNA processing and 40S ribosomal subunit assembly [Kazachstania unispora]